MPTRLGLPTVLTVALLLSAAPATAKSYRAERFDARAALTEGGTLEVTETIVFRFEDGTFKEAFRQIPQRRTDGIEVLHAGMDGVAMPLGTQPGQVEVRRRSGVRVTWRFPRPVAGSTHTLTLTYRVHGVVRESPEGDLLLWRMLPSEHGYAIDHGTFAFALPASLAAPPAIETRRVAGRNATQGDGRVEIALNGIRRNGWADVRLLFPTGTVIAAAPMWQQSMQRADALGPRWLGAGAVVLAAGLVLLWAVRQRYDAPGRHVGGPTLEAHAPDDLRPAAAGAMAANGRISLVHAMAGLFDLAERGALTIEEEPRGLLSSRSYVLERRTHGPRLASHEEVLLDSVFTDKGAVERRVPLGKARSRIGSKMKDFTRALYGELTAAGLIDAERRRVHARLGQASLAILLLAVVLFGAGAILAREYRAWPLAVPGAALVVALVGFMMQGAVTPLSNEGLRRRDRWRAHQRHLKGVARHELQLTSDAPGRVLPVAVALGLASPWSKFMKAHPAAVPAWFQAASAVDHGDSFAAFVAYGGGASSGSGGAGGGAAAGGGASGAS